MRKSLVAFFPVVAVGLASMVLTNCGGTDGATDLGDGILVETACDGGGCLELSAPSSVETGEDRGIGCTLRSASGTPQSSTPLRFEFEGGTVTPASALTNSGGHVSATLNCTTVGSHILTCRAPSGFNLESRRQVSCSPGCGNLIVESPEECDDGNTISGDGCDADCRIELND